MTRTEKAFLEAWAKEISAYKQVLLGLLEQKQKLINWDMKEFEKSSKSLTGLINQSHKNTELRAKAMKQFILALGEELGKISLSNLNEYLEDEQSKERAIIYYQGFCDILKQIDLISDENKELIKTGLTLVGDNISILSELNKKNQFYSNSGLINQQKSAVLLSKRV